MGHLGTALSGEQQVTVHVTTLDSAEERFGRPDFIKMDIEGGEIAAIRGATAVLRDSRPLWLIELHDAVSRKYVRDILQSAGYTFSDLTGNQVPENAHLPSHVLARPMRGSGGIVN